jgi:hypothetical protein
MIRRDARDGKAPLWQQLWLAAALGVFGGMPFGSAVSSQEGYPPPPTRLSSPEIDQALDEVAAWLAKEGERPEVGEQVVEYVTVTTRPKDPSKEPLSRVYSFTAVAEDAVDRIFDVCDGSTDPCFDVPNADTSGTKLKKVPSDKEVTLKYHFSPAILVKCVGNRCRQTGS